MNRDKQNRITIVMRQLPKLIDNQMEEQVIKHLEELETLSDRDDVYKILQNNVLPQVIYNRIPWLYGVFIRNARSSKLCVFLADDLAIYPLIIRELKNDLEKEKENHESTKRQKTIPKWILIIAIAVTGIATSAGTASIAAAYNKIQPYEQEIQQLKETIQINQGEIKNLQAKLNELQAQVKAGERAVVQAKQISKESEDLKRKNVALNNRLYQIKRTIPCRIFGCQ